VAVGEGGDLGQLGLGEQSLQVSPRRVG